MPELLPISAIVLVAAMTQSLTGFGFALVSMSLLPSLIGIQSAVPLLALISVLSNTVLWLIYRQAAHLQTILQLSLAAICALPVGLLLLRHLPEQLALKGLGGLLVGYVLYNVFQQTLPILKARYWIYGAGFVSGLLTGAYNTGGPPVVVYGSCQQWTPPMFKGNLSGFFLISSIAAFIGHSLEGNFTPDVLRYALYALPAFLIGLGAGIIGSRYLNPARFKQVILGLLFLTGLNLLISSS